MTHPKYELLVDFKQPVWEEDDDGYAYRKFHTIPAGQFKVLSFDGRNMACLHLAMHIEFCLSTKDFDELKKRGFLVCKSDNSKLYSLIGYQ